jgi:hypothetical protein
MEIAFAEGRAFSLIETLSWEEVKERAWDNKAAAFASGLGKIFARRSLPAPNRTTSKLANRRNGGGRSGTSVAHLAICTIAPATTRYPCPNPKSERW